MTDDARSIVALPFLKTHAAVSLGGFNFRSTDDLKDLPPEHQCWVREISGMLFLQDDFRIRSATYAIVPRIEPGFRPVDLAYLMNIQATVAYLYAAPHPTFGDAFLPSEYASMAVFTPDRVPVGVIRPDFHVEDTRPKDDLAADARGKIAGYSGIYNFRHYFWVANGSRLYGPAPRMALNHSQDLAIDLMRASDGLPYYQMLMHALEKPPTAATSRIFTALHWFNLANRRATDGDGSIVNLSIAFEALLGLPKSEKTDRLVDAISLLLGRVPRLDSWARQFYEARSQVVHEGRARQRRFFVTDLPREGAEYQSLLSYGGQIFRLCLGTLLVGADMAERAGLEERLVTNQERFERVCRLLSDEAVGPDDRLSRISDVVDLLEANRFIGVRLKPETMLSAVKLAAKALLACETSLSQERSSALGLMIAAKRGQNHLDELQALHDLEAVYPVGANPALLPNELIVAKLVQVIWDVAYSHYYWLKEQGVPEADPE